MKIYNTLSQKLEELVPIQPGKINMYVCGVTVYDHCHLGHGRAYVVFDSLRRYLEHCGFAVTHIQNFTDIDDKIIKKVIEEKTELKNITEKYIQSYFEDMEKLNIKKASNYPRVVDHLPEIIQMIQTLIQKNYAYEKQGEVFYRIHQFKEYGKLSKKNIEQLLAGARVETNHLKEHALDFSLWKASKPGEPFWESPWGPGRPGWHIECSAMAQKFLGAQFDIHGGGMDLIFPHHENEIAQSEAASGKKFANYWVHNGFVSINQEKMSKSKGNFFSLKELLQKFPGEVLRFFLLSTHYHHPINFSLESVEECGRGMESLYHAVESDFQNTQELPELLEHEKKFLSFLEEDLNTAGAIGVLFDIARLVNREQSLTGQIKLKKLGNILGFFEKDREKENLDQAIQLLVEQRETARKNKDFATSDRIRDELKAQGIVLEDTAQGIRWKKK